MSDYDRLQYDPAVTLDRKLLINELKQKLKPYPYLKRIKSDKYTFHVESDEGNFSFTVRNPTVTTGGKSNINYECSLFPKVGTMGKLIDGHFNGERHIVLKRFDAWLNYVNEILNLTLEDDDDEVEYAEVVDEETIEPDGLSSTENFPEEKVIVYQRFLEYTKRYIAYDYRDKPEEVKHIIEEVAELQESLPNVSQQEGVAWYEKIRRKAGKIKGIGKDLSKKMLVEFFKFEMQEFLRGNIPEQIERVKHLLENFGN